MVSVPIAEVNEPLEALLKLLRFVGYRGIFSAEYKLDDLDGRFKLLDVNVRPWWFIEFTQSCNVDVCGLAYNDALGRPLADFECHGYEAGRFCMYSYLDVQAYLRGQGRLLSIVNSGIRSKSPIFSWDDPGPAFAQFQEVAGRYVRRRLTAAM